MGQQFGDTTLTKVFVGGLAWETQKETLREHFEQYGEILEAVIISDKLTGRSKGYGFVTFKDAEAAKKACEDATPVINGRRANCNLASLGAKTRLRNSPPTTPVPAQSPIPGVPQPGLGVGPTRGVSPGPAAAWYYHPSTTPPPPAPYHHHQHQTHHPPTFHGVLPFYTSSAASYGYSPNYMADLSYNTKLSPTAGGSYIQGQFSYPAQMQGGVVAPSGMLPYYTPYYHYQHHHSQGLGVPAAHFFPPVTATAMATIPTLMPKPAVLPPKVETVTGCS
ncbi:RNA-binding (RRM/RBD/RNP motifs) family protein [Rhynchospora pubera]|uniref:RNA-binding (RRM/RBD/RNP motifs) family protein n=1 Tax=Rhynchospora pubera TaxID=906938 RepID=A0AAV8D674_9POAL|nr:RNA-binding (RRM/RBD/RNP motifs) family protein [Rhynchospora pubera]